ncbi:putative Two-component system sensor kinase [Streptomyces misionensis JCM 4497]
MMFMRPWCQQRPAMVPARPWPRRGPGRRAPRPGSGSSHRFTIRAAGYVRMHGDRTATGDRGRRVRVPDRTDRLVHGRPAAQGRRRPPRDPAVGAAAARPRALPAGALRRPAQRLLRPGEAVPGAPGRRRADADPGADRGGGLAGDPDRGGRGRDDVQPLRARPPRRRAGPPGAHPGDADHAGGLGDRRGGRGGRDAADLPGDARGGRLPAGLGRCPRHRGRGRRPVDAGEHVRRAADRLRRHGPARRHRRRGRRVGHGRGDHPDLSDGTDLGRAPDHHAGVVLHLQALRELVAGDLADDRDRLLAPRPQRPDGRDAREAARHPARVPGLGRPRLRPGGDRLDAEHHPGARAGDREGRRRHMDGAGRGPRADDQLVVRRAPLRAAPGEHLGRGAPALPSPLPGPGHPAQGLRVPAHRPGLSGGRFSVRARHLRSPGSPVR